MLDNYGYNHTLTICNTNCFPSAAMVMRTRPTLTLSVHCLSCYTGQTKNFVPYFLNLTSVLSRFFVQHVYSTCSPTVAVAQWSRCCATNRKVAGSIPAGVSGIFIDIKSFRSHYGPGVDTASNRNEYQEYFLGVKAAGA